MTASPTAALRLSDPARTERADPRVARYLELRWAECWPSLGAFDCYPPTAWSAAICAWAEHELARIEELLVRVDAHLREEAA